MQKSVDRILTTHAGSLPRAEPLGSMLIDQELGQPVDAVKLKTEIDKRVAHVLAKQAEVGIDSVNDGEQGRIGFQTYVAQRMSGYGGASNRHQGADWVKFPQYAARFAQRLPEKMGKVSNAPQAIAEVKYEGQKIIADETERLTRLGAAVKGKVVETYMNAASPGIISTTMHNAFYKTQDDYLFAVAKQMAQEYAAVVKAGHILQIDAPDMAMERTMLYRNSTENEYLAILEKHVAALNMALEGVPKDRVRLHVCWGNWEGPHVHDIAMEKVLPFLYKANVGALGLEFGNSAKQHETAAVKKNPPPGDLILVAGVVDSKSNIVDHQEVVAQRIERVVDAVGDRERVWVSPDCGFGTFVGYEWVTEDVVWAKLENLRKGADIASARIWGRKAA